MLTWMPSPSLLGRALDFAFPARCAGCDREGAPICPACLPALRVRAGLPGGLPIGLPSDVPAPLLQLEWCAPFEGTVRRALHRLKYGGERRLAVPLGRAVGARWLEAGVGTDIVVPVPVHADRERARGFDQAVLIADVAASILRLPLHRLLVRTRATTAQYTLGHDERAANMTGAFALTPGWTRAREGTEGRWVLLIDDVVTTGSTLAACADVLLQAGAVGVSAVTVARER
jgi:ComF family protein